MNTLLKLLAVSVALCLILGAAWSAPCTPDDIGTTYTECKSDFDNRYVVYYKIRDCDGDHLIPVSNVSFPCNLTCANGQYLAPPLTQCKACSAGYVSNSEGININRWNDWPENMYTYCLPRDSGCDSWQLRDTYLSSGSQYTQANIMSNLYFAFEIVRETGSISFRYKVDSEKASDGLEFIVDNYLVMKKQTRTVNYVTAEFELPRGFHRVEWRFIKNSANGKGKEKAFIKEIQVRGTKYFEEECTPCAPGSFSNTTGAEMCQLCAPGTYANVTASSKCLPCAEDEYSLEGAANCIKKRLCTADDITGTYTECKGGKRQLKFAWRSPKVCYGGAELPKDEDDVPCAPCPTGKYRDANDQCVACPAGEYLGVDAKCKPCTAGTAAIRKTVYDNFAQFTELPAGWKTECRGNCKRSPGWTVVSDPYKNVGYLDSGVDGDFSALTLPVNFYSSGKISFEYSIQNKDNDKESAIIIIYLDEKVLEILDKNSMLNQEKATYTSKLLDQGSHNVVIAFEKFQTSDTEAKAMIYNMKLEGEQNGGTNMCDFCPAGYQCPAKTDRFIPCTPGTYSRESSPTCDACPSNTFTDQPATPNSCKPCGQGTTSKPGSSFCDNTCLFTVSGTEITYDLRGTAFIDYYGPFKYGNTSEEVYFSLCKPMNTTNYAFCRRKLYFEDKEETLNTYACAQSVEWETVSDIGHTIAYKALSVESRGKGLTVEMKGGSICPGTYEERKTFIDFSCNVKAGRGYPELDQMAAVLDGEACSTRFKWDTSLACPLCTKFDYDSNLTPCKNGRRKKVYYWKTPQVCNDEGVALPQEEIMTCPICTTSDYTSVISACVNGYKTKKFIWKEPRVCTDGVSLPSDQQLPCDEVAVDKLTILFIIAGICVVFFVMAVVLCCLYQKNQSLYRQYSVLSSKNKNKLQALGLESDDDDDDDDDDNLADNGGTAIGFEDDEDELPKPEQAEQELPEAKPTTQTV